MGNYFNNGQRVPTIFEIATAFENGDDGYIQQKRMIIKGYMEH